MILVTGGAGFIGSAFILQWIKQEQSFLINLDKLTYAANIHNLDSLKKDPLYHFIQGDICQRQLIKELLHQYKPQYIVHAAAESHVDRSIANPQDFIQTNVVGTFILLEEALDYWLKLPKPQKENFRFLHVSTDEVYGSISDDAAPATEASPYAPNSPYAASKAASDHLVRAYFKTYQLPVLTAHSCNNFGPRQFSEKLIPLAIRNALLERPIPLYGDGLNLRDWLYVDDHCEALRVILKHGLPGEVYNVSTQIEKTNLSVIQSICHILDAIKPRPSGAPYQELIQFVADRPGHDRRYALSSQKMQNLLGWRPKFCFESALRQTIQWYIDHPQWLERTSEIIDRFHPKQTNEDLC